MHRIQFSHIESDLARINRLNRAIEEAFGHLATDEVEIMGEDFEEVVEDLFEVVRVGKRKCRLEALKKPDANYGVLIPPTIVGELSRFDPFWVVLGLRDGVYHLIYMSPHYRSGRAVEQWAARKTH